MTRMATVMVLACLGSGAQAALADGAADAGWKGKGELGWVMARGNTDTDTLNAKLEMSHEVGPWKHTIGMDALRASTSGNTTADRYGARWQSDYKLSARSYAFGGLAYGKDRFSGFDYQESAIVGYGYKFIDDADTKFNGEIGAGYRKSKDSVPPLQSHDDGILHGKLSYDHKLSATTKLVDTFLVDSGSSNTFMSNDLALQVKMSDKLALAVGYGIRRNSNPPAPLKQTDTLSTVSLVYAF